VITCSIRLFGHLANVENCQINRNCSASGASVGCPATEPRFQRLCRYTPTRGSSLDPAGPQRPCDLLYPGVGPATYFLDPPLIVSTDVVLAKTYVTTFSILKVQALHACFAAPSYQFHSSHHAIWTEHCRYDAHRRAVSLRALLYIDHNK